MTEYTDRESMPILPSVEGVELEAGDRVRSLRWEGYEGTVRGVQAADPQVPGDEPMAIVVWDGASFSEDQLGLDEVELVAKADDGAEPPAAPYAVWAQ